MTDSSHHNFSFEMLFQKLLSILFSSSLQQMQLYRSGSVAALPNAITFHALHSIVTDSSNAVS
jgi:hypothetical protein